MYKTLMLLSSVMDAVIRAAGEAIYRASVVANKAESKAVEVRRAANTYRLDAAKAAAVAAQRQLIKATDAFVIEARAINADHPGHA